MPCEDICEFPIWNSDTTFRPKSTPTLPKELLDRLNARKYASESREAFQPTKDPMITARDISGTPWRGKEPFTYKPFEPKFTPSIEGVSGVSFAGSLAKRSVSVKPYTEEEVNQLLDMVYDHMNGNAVPNTPRTPRNSYAQDTQSTPRTHHKTPKRCPDAKTYKRAQFVFGYMRELIRYIRTTTAVNYVPDNTVPPNVSHKMVTFVGTKIDKLISSDPKLLGTRHHMKVRLYKKIYIPLVIAVRHRDELMRLRVAHKEVRADYADIMSRLDKRATVGVNLSVPAINQDILTYIERYGMPEEFLFDPLLMLGIKNEAMG
jgi:hypothetical protein